MKISKLVLATALLMVASQGCERQKSASDAGVSGKAGRSSSSSSVVESVLSKDEFEDPADGYFHAYSLVREAERSESREESIRHLQEAKAYFQSVKSRFPVWKTSMVDARIANTRESLAKLSPPEH